MKIRTMAVTFFASIFLYSMTGYTAAYTVGEPNAALIEVNNCSEAENQLLDRAVSDSYGVMDNLISEISLNHSNGGVPLSRNILKKLKKAKYILKCAALRTKNLSFTCTGASRKGFMSTIPIFGNEVTVTIDDLGTSKYEFIVASIIHEATHKCGTNDTDYFIENDKVPSSNWLSEWQNIASTYDYWAVEGFCIPEVDC